MDASPVFSINSSFSCNGVSEEKDKQAFANYQRILALLAEASAQPGVEVAFDIKMHVSSAASEHPPLPASPPPEREEVAASEEEEDSACNICGDLPQWVEMEKERGICCTCAEHMDEGLKYYTEDFAHASEHGKDALHLFVLRQRADNCRDTICAAAGSYDGDLEAHEASVQEKLLNKRAAECLARLPPSFAPWWKDTWSHEKWCQVYAERKAAGCPVEKDAPIVQRLAAMFLAEQKKVHELKKKGSEEKKQAWEEGAKQGSQATEALMKLKHDEVVAKCMEDMEALKGLHAREMTAAQARYADALAPLLGIRDKMREECEKKCEDARRRGYAMGYAFADQKWNPVYKAVCEELELVRKEGANHQDAYMRLFGERDELVLKEADLMHELDESAEANEKLEAQMEALRMELASAKGNLEGTEVAAREATTSAMQVVEGLRKELTTTKADLIRAQDSAAATATAAVGLNEELVAARKELSGWYERCVAAQNAAKNLEGEVDAATKLFQAMRSDLERLNAENKALRQKAEEDKQMVQRHLKEVDKGHAEMMAWETERLREENKELQKKHAGLLELVNPTIKLMKSNPELFGGEALPSGATSPRPPPIIRLAPMKEEVKEEVKEETLNFLRSILVPPSRPCLLVESPSTALPGLEEAEPSSSQTEGLCMALTGEQVQQMQQAEAMPETTRVSCVGCGKPKPDYNHPNWPSPITKRFAKHLAKHSGRPGQDPKTIRTHEDALEYIAKRGNISVETLLQWTMKHYQSFSQPWTLVEGPNKFNMGTAPATWWC